MFFSLPLPPSPAFYYLLKFFKRDTWRNLYIHEMIDLEAIFHINTRRRSISAVIKPGLQAVILFSNNKNCFILFPGVSMVIWLRRGVILIRKVDSNISFVLFCFLGLISNFHSEISFINFLSPCTFFRLLVRTGNFLPFAAVWRDYCFARLLN